MSKTDSRWQNVGEFKACVRVWAQKIGVHPTRIQVQRTTQKWASCSSSGTLTFGMDLLTHDKEVGEAVVVHELIHLKVRNHGRLFKSLFHAYLPSGDALLNQHLRKLD